ncbi:glycosyl hydrolase family 28 protein [Cerasicoccus maritimus]|uniref:glycosyl hydrolase family 28 protein n=1 Tax=Cerasicoccus maritimus TaxID=490089 RepID=UPI002852CA11|nr:glycosyl hydrolase family 28 protein [Cerasicoccus maritimus]
MIISSLSFRAFTRTAHALCLCIAAVQTFAAAPVNRTASAQIESIEKALNVVPHPGHATRPISPRYEMIADSQRIDVRDGRFDFDEAMFSMGDSPIEVTIYVKDDFTDFTLKPDRHGIDVEKTNQRLTFTLFEPNNLVLQIPGQKPLAIHVTPKEVNPPSAEDADVIYFGPGVTTAGVIQPKSGQTVYLAPGAVVKGRIEATGVKDVKLLGRGILETEGYALRDEKKHGILFDQCENIYVEGIGVRSWDTWWQILFLNTIDSEVAHINVYGVGVNTDGVDIDAVKNFVVRDSFLRVEDDGLGWHSLDAETNGELITENVLADNLVIWNTRWGNGIRIGASMEAQLWRNITIRNVDILMHNLAGIYSDYSDWAWMQNLRFENMTIEKSSNPIDFKIGQSRYSNSTGYLSEYGHFDGLLFDNITMTGGTIRLSGYDSKHRINAVRFNNCIKGGQPVKSMSDISINQFVTDVAFNEPLPQIRTVAPGIFEAEDQESRVSGGAQFIHDHSTASQGRSRFFLPREAGAMIEHDFEADAGDYTLSLTLGTNPQGGQVEVRLNDQVINSGLDLSSLSSGLDTVNLGNVTIAQPGVQTLRLTYLGTPDSSQTTKLMLDTIELQPN